MADEFAGVPLAYVKALESLSARIAVLEAVVAPVVPEAVPEDVPEAVDVPVGGGDEA